MGEVQDLAASSGVSEAGTAQLDEVGDKQDSVILMALLLMVLFQRSAMSFAIEASRLLATSSADFEAYMPLR